MSGNREICTMWHDHFKSLLNSCTDFSKKDQVICDINPVICMKMFNVENVKDAIKDLKIDKSSGADSLTSEHFIYADVKVNVLLSLLFNCMTVNAFISLKLMKTIIVPFIKNCKGVLTDKDNY